MQEQSDIMDDINKDVERYVFQDNKIDHMYDFDFYARQALIDREITKKDYLIIEEIRKDVILKYDRLSGAARNILKEILSGL